MCTTLSRGIAWWITAVVGAGWICPIKIGSALLRTSQIDSGPPASFVGADREGVVARRPDVVEEPPPRRGRLTDHRDGRQVADVGDEVTVAEDVGSGARNRSARGRRARRNP
jgi:hypothetical protein